MVFNLVDQKRIKSGLFLLLFLFIFGMIQGCASNTYSPQKQLTGIYDQYNIQYTDYMYATGHIKENGIWLKTSSPTLSEERKILLRKKKDILTKVYPLITLYDNILTTDGDIPPNLMPQIITLLNKLLTL